MSAVEDLLKHIDKIQYHDALNDDRLVMANLAALYFWRDRVRDEMSEPDRKVSQEHR
jgi:hypothetical protein